MGAWLWLVLACCHCKLRIRPFSGSSPAAIRPKYPILGSSRPGLTVLKPLCGAKPGLEANLISFCNQNCRGPLQLVLGVQSPADPPITVAKHLKELFTDHDIELVVDFQRHGANGKISNIINILARTQHEIVVVSDSDIRVEPQYLQSVISTLLAEA